MLDVVQYSEKGNTLQPGAKGQSWIRNRRTTRSANKIKTAGQRPYIEHFKMIIDIFYGHICAHSRLNGFNDLKSNESKSKMKQTSDMPTPRFEPRWC